MAVGRFHIYLWCSRKAYLRRYVSARHRESMSGQGIHTCKVPEQEGERNPSRGWEQEAGLSLERGAGILPSLEGHCEQFGWHFKRPVVLG